MKNRKREGKMKMCWEGMVRCWGWDVGIERGRVVLERREERRNGEKHIKGEVINAFFYSLSWL